MTTKAHFEYPPPLVPEPVPSRDEDERSEDSARRTLMPRALRALGAALLVIAASSFLFRDWGQHDDAVRYLMLLGQLGLLAGAGFYCGLKLEEKRGARTFLSLVVAVTPVHFAVLGGIVYSQLALDAPSSHLAAHAVWQVTDATTAIGLTLGAQLLLIPATFISMMTLARRHAGMLTLANICISAMLLIPVREPNAVAILVAAASPLVLILQLRVFSGTPTLSTPQGRFVRAMLVMPVLVIIGRTLLYYPTTAPFSGVALFSCGLMSFAYVASADRGRRLMRSAVPQLLALGAMLSGYAIIAGDFILGRANAGSGFGALDLPVIVVPWAVIILIASRFTARGTVAYRRLAGLIATFGVCANLLAFNELAAGLVAVATGATLTIYGTRVKRKGLIALGVASSMAGLVSLALLTIRVEAITHWASLTAIGVALIFGAAALDRNRQRLLRRLAALRGRLEGWRY